MKQILVFFGASGFVVLGCFTFIWDASYLIMFVGILAIIFFGLIALTVVIDFFKFRPALRINDKGIHNYSHVGRGYVVNWENIETLRIKKIEKQKVILINVFNPEEIYCQVDFFSKWWMKINHRIYGTPVSIPSVMIGKKIEDVLFILQEGRLRFK